MKILVCEDERSIREFIVINLKRNGYEVIAASDGREAVDMYENDVDIVLLDLMMPHKDGLQVCREIREKSSSVGIIMLTAKSQESDKVNGLLAGADDYITKPFSVNELLARVSALSRRVISMRHINKEDGEDDNFIESGPFVLDLREHVVFKNGKKIELTVLEFKILKTFMKNKGKHMSRKEIVEQVWGEGLDGDEKILDVNIRRVRKKIEDDPTEPRYIQTLWAVGYVWRE